jgi:hypothetical protein
MIPLYVYESTRKFSQQLLFGIIENLSCFNDEVVWVTTNESDKSWVITNSFEFYSTFSFLFRGGLFQELDGSGWLTVQNLCYDNYFILYGDTNYYTKSILGENCKGKL